MIEVTMGTRSIRKRIARLEKLMSPQYDEDGNVRITLEELCRPMWKRNRKKFIKLVKGTSMQVLICQFQAEDAIEAADNARRRLHHQ